MTIKPHWILFSLFVLLVWQQSPKWRLRSIVFTFYSILTIGQSETVKFIVFYIYHIYLVDTNALNWILHVPNAITPMDLLKWFINQTIEAIKQYTRINVNRTYRCMRWRTECHSRSASSYECALTAAHTLTLCEWLDHRVSNDKWICMFYRISVAEGVFVCVLSNRYQTISSSQFHGLV